MSNLKALVSAPQGSEPTKPSLPKMLYLQPRCRVCRNDQARVRVNEMLARGATFASIVRSLGQDNAELDRRDRITIDSVRRHASRHFCVQNLAGAAYREILEQRAQQNAVDFINGLATAITPMVYYETVIAKGYETLVDSGITVDVNAGMIAAGRLQSLLDSRVGQPDVADMMVQLNRIIDAVKITVPQQMWGEIRRKLGSDREVVVETSEYDDADDVLEPDDEPFDPDDYDPMGD